MHKYFMLAALEQAWFGRGNCAPNPSVGAVAVHKGEIIARAWHQGAGTAHAEQLLVAKIPAGLQDVSLYVTLEPCNHWGKTPPCAMAILGHGITQVIYGFSDPNPIVRANNTPEILRKNGIEALHYPIQEIDAFYQSYNHWTKTKRPWVTAKIAQTLDGKIAGVDGQRCQLSNADCAEFTHQHRLYTDVILTTAKTIAQDDPLLNVRLKDREQGKRLAIIDSRLSLSKNARIFSSAEHCHIFHDENYAVTNPFSNCSYYGISAREGLLDLALVINQLGELGYHDVWVEAGGALFSALHREKLVQRTYFYLVPEVLGENATPAFQGEVCFTTRQAVSWQVKSDNVIACLDWQEEETCLQV
ncbi:TPA: bifunctional diaminohydroxyphosphoribosylaminopyrimidine deaminase/5-amino-6-(5-phosphoribosylamino)uracil reductase RibD [Legionella feeleii]